MVAGDARLSSHGRLYIYRAFHPQHPPHLLCFTVLCCYVALCIEKVQRRLDDVSHPTPARQNQQAFLFTLKSRSPISFSLSLSLSFCLSLSLFLSHCLPPREEGSKNETFSTRLKFHDTYNAQVEGIEF